MAGGWHVLIVQNLVNVLLVDSTTWICVFLLVFVLNYYVLIGNHSFTTFFLGQVIDTPEGPRLLPPDIKGDGNLEYLVQGFDINQEEARLIAGGSEAALAGDLVSKIKFLD